MVAVSAALSSALNRPGASNYARQFFSPAPQSRVTSGFILAAVPDGIGDTGVARAGEPADAPAEVPVADNRTPFQKAVDFMRDGALRQKKQFEDEYAANRAGSGVELVQGIRQAGAWLDGQRIGFLVLGGGMVLIAIGALVAPQLGFASIREEMVRSNAITTNRAVRGAFKTDAKKSRKKAKAPEPKPPEPPEQPASGPAPDAFTPEKVAKRKADIAARYPRTRQRMKRADKGSDS